MSAVTNKVNSQNRIEVPPAAKAILAHAIETFGSELKTWLWLERPNPLFAGSTPLQILQANPAKYDLIEDELTRIDHGVFI